MHLSRSLVIACLTVACCGCFDDPVRPTTETDTFPPEADGQFVVVGGAAVFDIDGDGADDIVVLNRRDDSQQGLYILPGSASVGISRFSLDLKTNGTPQLVEEIAPHAVWVGDIHGTSAPELVVYGNNGDDTAMPTVLMVYSDITLDAVGVPQLLRSNKSAPVGDASAFFAAGNFSGDSETSLVFGFNDQLLWVQLTQDSANVETATIDWLYAPATGYQNIRGAGFTGGANANFDDIVVATQSDNHWVPNDGSGGPNAIAAVPALSGGQAVTAMLDLNSDGRLDVLAANDTQLGASVVDTPGTVHELMGVVTGTETIVAMEPLEVVEPTAHPEVMLAARDTMGNSSLQLLANMRTDSTVLFAEETRPTVTIADFEIVVMVLGDFNADGTTEVVVFDAAGNWRCFVPSANQIRPCS